EELDVIDVRYRDPPGHRGAFLRALRDRLFTLSQHEPGFSAEIAHAIDGRVRLRVDGVGDDAVVRLASWIAALRGIARASASPASRSILIFFDPRETSAETILTAIRESSPDLWPPGPAAPSRPAYRTLLFNTAVFAATLSGAAPPPLITTA